MASQAPPNGPGRGISQLYPTVSAIGMRSQAPSPSATARGIDQLHPSASSSNACASKAPSRAPSAAPTPFQHPSARPSHAATLRGPSQAPTMVPSHAATLRGQYQAPSSYTSHRPGQYITGSRMPSGATELRRDAASNSQAPRHATIMVQPPSNARTLLQRDSTTITPHPSTRPTSAPRDKSQMQQQTVLQRDKPQMQQQTLHQQDKPQMQSSSTAIKQATIVPIIGPAKKFENAPSVRSVLHSTNDIQMASRQSVINQLQGPEREAQEKWALGKLGELTTGCPQNFGWSRRGDGYICDGGSHYITDDLLAEGMGGMFAVKDKHDWQNRSEGPYYWAGRNEQGTNLFMKVASPEMK